MATLAEVAAEGDALPLAGLVFHGSRSGSTLVSQVLSRVASVRVMSEPAPLASILSICSSEPVVSDPRCRDWLQWTVAALGRSRGPGEEHLVIKMDAWAVLYRPLILEAFPTTPWVFVYRDPVEVIVSQLANPGYGMFQQSRLSPERHVARLLAAWLRAAAAPGDRRSMLVEYRELPEAVTHRIAPFFGIEVTPDDVAAMTEAAGNDAKNPLTRFVADGAEKQRQATEQVREEAER
jgi:hypothetical protein